MKNQCLPHWFFYFVYRAAVFHGIIVASHSCAAETIMNKAKHALFPSFSASTYTNALAGTVGLSKNKI